MDCYEGSVRRRLCIKPGITGLWQISGRSDLSWEESVRLDLYYVENWSLTGDLMIMWRTAKSLIETEGGLLMAARSQPPPPQPLHLAMIGTRGVPAAYGGFETAVEEIGSRLAGRGHDVTVYCRHAEDTAAHEYAGMHLVHLPALPLKTAETLSHTALSVAHLAMHLHHPDAAFVFNAANAPFIPILHARGVPVAVHVDGLEWQRDKWHGAGRAYYRWAEQSAVRNADALIADAKGIADYYASEFGASTRQIAYGAPVQLKPVFDRLEELGLMWKGYHLAVARFEPENHVDLIVAGYELSDARRPLVVVGAAPYAEEYTAGPVGGPTTPRVRLLGALYDQDLLDQLYAGALSYSHGHSVGGTNPSLLRAMGAGTAVLAWDCPFNREVAGRAGKVLRRRRVARRADRCAGARPTGPCATARPCARSSGRSTAGTTSPSPTRRWRSS